VLQGREKNFIDPWGFVSYKLKSVADLFWVYRTPDVVGVWMGADVVGRKGNDLIL